jgi:hypothetical protein
MAARNNADWCALVSALHGAVGTTDGDAWTSPVRTPDFYPDAVTLRPGVDPRALVSRLDCGPGCSVKDSFADLDLEPLGFDVLFEATWIHLAPPAGHGPAARVGDDAPAARVVDDEPALDAWAAAWSGGTQGPHPFIAGLLGRTDVRIIELAGGAGAVLSLAGGAVGVSNVSAAPGRRLVDAFCDAAGMAAAWQPDRPVVGYEAGDGLHAALAAGFEPVGPLRVWLRR